MIKIDVEAAGLRNCLTGMVSKLEQFGTMDMPQEFLRWQIDDMNRQYPNLEQPDDKSAYTMIWPRSRTWMPGRRRQRGKPRPLRRSPVIKGRQKPILRPFLFDDLSERMEVLMYRRLTWG